MLQRRNFLAALLGAGAPAASAAEVPLHQMKKNMADNVEHFWSVLIRDGNPALLQDLFVRDSELQRLFLDDMQLIKKICES